jgi:1-acyl-sn-glycerol-3-phosphate acyltransferase
MLSIKSIITICSITDLLNRIHTKILEKIFIHKKEDNNLKLLYSSIKYKFRKILTTDCDDDIEKTYISFQKIYYLLD